jgi:oxygen-independent coproporphyrinogen-3 oxidase
MPPAHLYVHVPFCARRCSYCDFSIAVRSQTPIEEYTTALKAELSQGSVDGATLDTVYLGGGTPSRLGGAGVTAVLDAIRSRAKFAYKAEVTIEANPDDVNDIAVAQWVAAGVNRISLGAQSFDDGVLEWMHRTHDSSQIARAVETIRRAGIENISLDLIFALPAHLNRDWKNDVQRALDLAPTHVSLYGLTVEAYTPIARWADRGAVVEGSETQYEEEFLHAHEAMSEAGFDHYEVSNFSLPGKASRHNSAYWTGVPYAGVGPSAHSFDGAVRRWNVAAYAEWVRRLAGPTAALDPTAGLDLNAVLDPKALPDLRAAHQQAIVLESASGLDRKSIVAGEESLTAENREAEEVYLGLRTSRGLAIDETELTLVEPWRNAGWAELDPSPGVPGVSSGFRLRLTPTGWLRLDSIAASMAANRSNRANTALSATPSHCYI